MQNLVLCGFMGSGKSTVGPLVAAASGREFLDMDRFIEQKAGKSIPAIFAEEGEAGFREREHEACWELAARTGLVIASGEMCIRDSRRGPTKRPISGCKALHDNSRDTLLTPQKTSLCMESRRASGGRRGGACLLNLSIFPKEGNYHPAGRHKILQ